MPGLTGRREKQTGPVKSAMVTAVVLAGVACSLPAFASAADSTDTVPCSPTGGPSTTSDPTGGADPTISPTDDPTTGCQTSTTAPPTTEPPTTTTAPPTKTTAPPIIGPSGSVPPTTAAPTTEPPTDTTSAPPPPPPPPPVLPTEPDGTFTYTDTPPGDTTLKLPHGTITRAQIITRAEKWLTEKVPYSQVEWWSDADGTYRQDCSGYVSMAWALDQNIDFWTGNLNTVSHTIDPSDLLPGDTLMSVEHTIIFAGWTNAQHTDFDFFEEAHPGTVARFVVDAPLTAYTDNGFNAFRYDGVSGSGALPPDPLTGLSFASLSSGTSEIIPAGVSATEPAPAPWQKTVPDESALQALLASQKPTKTPAKVDPQLAALGISDGPAPTRVLFAAGILSLVFMLLALLRNPRIKTVALVRKPSTKGYRRKH